MIDTDTEVQQYMASFRKAIIDYPPATQELFIKKIEAYFTEKKQGGVLDQELKKLASPKKVVQKFATDFGVQAPKNRFRSTFTFILSLFLIFVGVTVASGIGFYFLVLKPELDVNDAFQFHFKLDDDNMFWGTLNSVEDSILVNNLEALVLSVSNGEYKLTYVDEESLSYRCQFYGEDLKPELNKLQQNLVLNFPKADFERLRCTFKIPQKLRVSAEFGNGSVILQHPKNDMNIQLENGQLVIHPDQETNYKYEITVLNGSISGLPEKPQGFAVEPVRITAKINNGTSRIVTPNEED